MKMMTRLPFPAPSRRLLAGAVLALSGCALSAAIRWPIPTWRPSMAWRCHPQRTGRRPAQQPGHTGPRHPPGHLVDRLRRRAPDRLVAQALAAASDPAAAGLAVQRSRLQAGRPATRCGRSLRHRASAAMPAAPPTRPTNGAAATPPAYRWAAGGGSVGTPAHPARHRPLGSRSQRGRPAEYRPAGDQRHHHPVLEPGLPNQSIATGQANLEPGAHPRTGAGPLRRRCGIARLEVRQALQNLQSQRASQSALEQQRVEVRNALTVLLDGTPLAPAGRTAGPAGRTQPAHCRGAAGRPARPPPRPACGRTPPAQQPEDHQGHRHPVLPGAEPDRQPGSSAASLGDVLRNPVATLVPAFRCHSSTCSARSWIPISPAPAIRSPRPFPQDATPRSRKWTTPCPRASSWRARSLPRRLRTRKRWKWSARRKCVIAWVLPICAPGWKRSRPGAMPSCRWRACARAS